MQFLSNPECVAWCAERSFPTVLYPGYRAPLPDPHPEDFHSVRIYPPVDSGRKVALANHLWSLVEGESVLVWLGAWDVWPSSEHMPLVTRLREALGERRPLFEAPGQVVTRNEAGDGISFLVVALLFAWDCHVISSTGRDAVIISHDEYGSFLSREASVAERAEKELADYVRPSAV